MFAQTQMGHVLVPVISPLPLFSFYVLLNLKHEVRSDFQIRSSLINQLQCLHECPPELFNKVEKADNRCPALAPPGVYQDTGSIL